MAHPNKKQASEGHNAKLRRMTRNYGSADPAANQMAPVNEAKTEGPEDDVGFGADSAAPTARADRPARKTVAANPVATYKKGGRVKNRSDGGDVSAIEMANKNQASAAINRARGGRLKAGKGSTVNVIIAPQGGNNAPPPGPPAIPPALLASAGGPPGMPPGAPPMPPPGPPPMGAKPPMMGGPPGMPPMRARGGKVAHDDEQQDEALIHKVLREEGLERSNKLLKGEARAAGGRIGLTAGAASGEGRLEKVVARKRDSKDDRAQAV